jgi:hypothetical protein
MTHFVHQEGNVPWRIPNVKDSCLWRQVHLSQSNVARISFAGGSKVVGMGTNGALPLCSPHKVQCRAEFPLYRFGRCWQFDVLISFDEETPRKINVHLNSPTSVAVDYLLRRT